MPARRYAFTPEMISDFVCRLSGGRSLAAVCRDADMPSRHAVYARMRADRSFAAQVEAVRDPAARGRAPGGARREMWSEALAEGILAALRAGFTLAEICRSPACPVGRAAVERWIATRPAFAAAYRAACAPRATDRGLRFGRGRRGGYDPGYGATIGERLMQGVSLRSLSRAPDMPHPNVVGHWMKRHPAFWLVMQRARRAQAEVLLDAAIEAMDVPHRRGPAARLLAVLWRHGYRPYAGQPIEAGSANWAATVADGARRGARLGSRPAARRGRKPATSAPLSRSGGKGKVAASLWRSATGREHGPEP